MSKSETRTMTEHALQNMKTALEIEPDDTVSTEVGLNIALAYTRNPDQVKMLFQYLTDIYGDFVDWDDVAAETCGIAIARIVKTGTVTIDDAE